MASYPHKSKRNFIALLIITTLRIPIGDYDRVKKALTKEEAQEKIITMIIQTDNRQFTNLKAYLWGIRKTRETI